MMMTESGQLLYGVEWPEGSGQLHVDFTLRLPTIGDNIAAIEQHGVASNIRINTAMLASCLVSLGNIPAEQLDFALVSRLVDDDFDTLASARDALKKKRRQPSSSLPATDSPSLPLAATASANPPSAS
ncbi:hypothetical protein DLM_1258 [Aquitalea magnusonii]|uniref:Tail assembly chaperone E/41/14-like protein n=1 Tax=Aquitalea magnusonii TaxID=332411 RepID=A0A3G9GFJ8_9NEIS|nr:hypothetical protein [Aquitalea magnusonii]BBF84882.1 hypothetical protein DLM_1258 [Aquitalea magnusonii]